MMALLGSIKANNVVADSPYPAKATVSFTFDDAASTTYTNALPVLSSKGLSATEYVNTGYVGKPGYMSWSQIQQLQNTYKWDIGGHSVTHPLMSTLNDTQLRYEVEQSKKDLIAHGITNPVSFATPYGDYSNKVIATIARYYQSHRPFHDRAYLNDYPYNKYLIYVKSVEKTTTVTEVKSWVDYAKSTNGWLVLVFHDVVTNPTDQYDVSTNFLKQIADYVKTSGIRNATVSEMTAYSKPSLFENGTFAQGLTGGWSVSNNAVLDTSYKGTIPNSINSVKLTGSSTASHLFSKKINVNPNGVYKVTGFTNTSNFKSGEAGYYVDEYDIDGNWISGKWLAGYTGLTNSVFESVFTYKPTSPNVKTAMLEVYMDPGSIGHIYVDTINMYLLLVEVPSVTPTPTISPITTSSPNPSASVLPSASPSASASATPIPTLSPTPVATVSASPSAMPSTSPSAGPIVNLVKNSGFGSVIGGWVANWQRDNTNLIVWSSASLGCAGSNSVKLEPNTNISTHLYSDLIIVESNKSYTWESCVKVGGGSGEFGYYIDEYDAGDQWVSGQWKMSEGLGVNITRKILYIPTSVNVKKVRLQYYKAINSTFSVIVDEVKLY